MHAQLAYAPRLPASLLFALSFGEDSAAETPNSVPKQERLGPSSKYDSKQEHD